MYSVLKIFAGWNVSIVSLLRVMCDGVEEEDVGSEVEAGLTGLFPPEVELLAVAVAIEVSRRERERAGREHKSLALQELTLSTRASEKNESLYFHLPVDHGR